MSLSSSQSILRGRFTSNGVSETIVLPWLPVRFDLLNITQFGSTAAATPVITAHWQQGMSSDSVITGNKTNGAATIQIPVMNSSDGIIVSNTSNLTPSLPITGTAVTRGATTTVTAANHGLKINDNVRLYNTTGMLQISGMLFTVQTVPGANSFTINLDSSGFAADATAVTIRRLPFDVYYPQIFYIGSITQAAQAVITVTQPFTNPTVNILPIGTIISLRVPSVFGMVEMNELQAEIVAVSGGVLTVDVDSRNFTAFAFPTSTTAASGITFAQLIPIGAKGAPVTFTSQFAANNVLANESAFEVTLGTNAIGGNNDIMEWSAYRSLQL